MVREGVVPGGVGVKDAPPHDTSSKEAAVKRNGIRHMISVLHAFNPAGETPLTAWKFLAHTEAR